MRRRARAWRRLAPSLRPASALPSLFCLFLCLCFSSRALPVSPSRSQAGLTLLGPKSQHRYRRYPYHCDLVLLPPCATACATACPPACCRLRAADGGPPARIPPPPPPSLRLLCHTSVAVTGPLVSSLVFLTPCPWIGLPNNIAHRRRLAPLRHEAFVPHFLDSPSRQHTEARRLAGAGRALGAVNKSACRVDHSRPAQRVNARRTQAPAINQPRPTLPPSLSQTRPCPGPLLPSPLFLFLTVFLPNLFFLVHRRRQRVVPFTPLGVLCLLGPSSSQPGRLRFSSPFLLPSLAATPAHPPRPPHADTQGACPDSDPSRPTLNIDPTAIRPRPRSGLDFGLGPGLEPPSISHPTPRLPTPAADENRIGHRRRV